MVAPFTSRGTALHRWSSSVNEKVLLKKILWQFLSQHPQICLGCEGKREVGRGGGRWEELGEEEERKEGLCPDFCYAGWGAGELAPKGQSDTELILRKPVGTGEGLTHGALGRSLISDLVQSSPSLRGHDSSRISRNASLSCAT